MFFSDLYLDRSTSTKALPGQLHRIVVTSRDAR